MGRTSLVLVIGFNILFASMGYNLSHVATNAYQNYINYYDKSVSHQLAASAANIAASQICFTPNWRDGYSNVKMGAGTFSVTAVDTSSGTQVAVSATATYNGVTTPIKLLLGLTKFSKFAYYSVVEGSINWITGDTVFGPFHTQSKLTVSGNPVFLGKATAKQGMVKSPSSSKPVFQPAFQSGIDINLPVDFSQIKGLGQSGGKYFKGKDIYLSFNKDGTVTYRNNSWTAVPATTVPINTLAPNGVIVVDSANLHLRGTLNGQVTVVALASTSGKGNVWIDSSVAYNTDPLKDKTSTDMLGIVADNNVIIKDTTWNDNSSKGVTLDASIMSRTGGLTAENYDSRPKSGTLTLVGGLQQYQRGAVGTFNSQTGQISTGFQKNYRYDSRLLVNSPPMYPNTGTYEVLSWFE